MSETLSLLPPQSLTYLTEAEIEALGMLKYQELLNLGNPDAIAWCATQLHSILPRQGGVTFTQFQALLDQARGFYGAGLEANLSALATTVAAKPQARLSDEQPGMIRVSCPHITINIFLAKNALGQPVVQLS